MYKILKTVALVLVLVISCFDRVHAYTYYMTSSITSSCRYSTSSSYETMYNSETGNIFGAASTSTYTGSTTTCYLYMRTSVSTSRMKFTLYDEDFCSYNDKLEVYNGWYSITPSKTYTKYSSLYSSYTSTSNTVMLKFTRTSCSEPYSYTGFQLRYSVESDGDIIDIVDSVGGIISGAIIAAIVVPLVIVVIIIVAIIGCCVASSRRSRPGAVITTVSAPPPPGPAPAPAPHGV